MSRLPLAFVTVACALWLDACSRTGLDVHSTGGVGSGGATSAATAISATGGGGGAPDTTATAGTSSGGANDARSDAPADTAATADHDCLIAIRTDTCCSDPFVISRYEMDHDPCVQPFFGPTYLPECVARQPSGCALVDCAFTPPLTRVVGRGIDGSCQYLSECLATDDCMRASDLRECCGCPYYYPRVLVQADGCLQDPATVEWERCPDSTCRSSSCMPHSCPAMPPATCGSNAAQTAAGLKACTWQVP